MSADGLAGLRQAVDALRELSAVVGADRSPDTACGLADYLSGDLADRRVLVLAHGESAPALGRALDHARQVKIWRQSWEELAPAREGRFDVVCCDGLLHRVLDPMALLTKLRSLLVPGGLLVIRTVLLDDPERSEYLRFLPTGHAGDRTWRFIFGRLAFRWMVQEAGFEPGEEFGEREGPREGLPLVSAFLGARLVGRDGAPGPLAPAAARLSTIPPEPKATLDH